MKARWYQPTGSRKTSTPPTLFLVEVDEDTAAYDKNHIRNAVRIDWQDDLQDPVRRDFVSKAQFEELLGRKGIANDDIVVLYGGNNNWFASYAYWYFKLYGHQDVRLLDGGRKKWELDSRELVEEVPERPATSYTAQEQDATIRAFRDDVTAAIGVENWSMSVAQMSTPASCWLRRTFRRNSHSARVTSQPQQTSRGARPPTMTEPSVQMPSSRSCTKPKASI